MSASPLSDICPSHRHRTQLLNEDFNLNGRILDALSVLYYPQSEGIFTDLQVLFEGNCYSMPYRYKPEKKSFEAYLYRMRHTNTYETFVRIGISLSPYQLNNIRSTIDVYNPKRNTTERSVNDFLEHFTDLSLPLYLTQHNNTTAATYLCMQKKLGNRHIGIVRIETKRVKVIKHTAETLCVGLDCFVYVMGVVVLISASILTIAIMARVTPTSFEEMETREPRIPRISKYLM